MVNERIAYQTELVPMGATDPITGYCLASSNALALSVDGTANTAAGGTVNTQIPIRVSGTRRYGITARKLVIARVQGTGTGTRLVYRRVPVFDPINFTVYLGSLSPSLTYETFSDWVLIGAQNERYRLFFNAS